jgi:predicted Zn finger-like uncharacterized protein
MPMSLITRCTACGTLFKVVADQLKVSEGWVRCGQCSEVFDAQANIVQEPMPSAAQSAPSTPVTLTQVAPTAAIATKSIANNVIIKPASGKNSTFSGLQEPISLSADSALPSTAAPSFAPGELPSEFPASRSGDEGPTSVNWSPSELAAALDDPRPIDIRLVAPPADTPPVDAPSTWAAPSVAPGFTASGADALQAASTLAPSAFSPSSIHTAPQSEGPAATPSFVREAKRAQRWRSPWVRLGLGLVALLLMALLAGQYAYQERDSLAAREPALKPALNTLCDWLRCKIEPPKHIEAIVVDSSSFNSLPTNGAGGGSSSSVTSQYYKLGVNLKNSGAMAVALPHVELSLRDGQDQTLLSRVLSPADLGVQAPSLQPSAEISGSVTVQVDTQLLQGQRISGYRVYAFYP